MNIEEAKQKQKDGLIKTIEIIGGAPGYIAVVQFINTLYARLGDPEVSALEKDATEKLLKIMTNYDRLIKVIWEERE